MAGRNQRHQHRSWEVHGPTPASLAVIAKPTPKHDPEWGALQRQKNDFLQMDEERCLKERHARKIHGRWMHVTDARIATQKIQEKIHHLQAIKGEELDQKREKLRALLLAEEEAYSIEIAGMQETPIERDARLREKVRQIRAKKMAEQQQIAQDKLDENFFLKSDEIRQFMSKRLHKQTAQERQESVIINRQVREERRAKDAAADGLVEQAIQRQRAREETEAKEAFKRNVETANTLRIQINANEIRKKMLEEDKKADREMIDQWGTLLDEEKCQEQLRKKQYQQDIRETLDRICKLKLSNKMKLDAETDAMNKKIVETAKQQEDDAVQDTLAERMEQTKVRRCFMAYAKDIAEERKKEEEKFHDFVMEEQRKQLQKEEEREQKIRRARNELHRQVRAEQMEQIRQKKEEKRHEKEQRMHFKAGMDETIMADYFLEEQRAAKRREDAIKYRKDLEMQIAFKAQQRELQKQQQKEEVEAQRMAEMEFTKRVREMKEHPPQLKRNPSHQHPFEASDTDP